MREQRRIGYHLNLRQRMSVHNLWKTMELIPLLKSREINLSNARVHRLVTGTPERISARKVSRTSDSMLITARPC